jgi:lipopolysaccharide/colanic/teichoic acid biosynthesis glycosyltransferase
MTLKWIFDRVVAFIGLLFLWPVLLIVAIMVKIKMPGGPAFFVQKRVGKDGKLFNCHKFRTMRVKNGNGNVNGNGNGNVNGNGNGNENENGNGNENGNENGNKNNGWSTVSVAGDSRITPFGATLRHYKLDELPGLWDVLIGNMSFVGPRPDVPGYADQLEGDDRRVLKLRPGITGPATLKYRLEDEYLANARELVAKLLNDNHNDNMGSLCSKSQDNYPENHSTQLRITLASLDKMTDQEVAEWYNDHVIYPDKVRLNLYYLDHYSFVKDIQMIVCTVLGKKMRYAGEEI